MPAGYSVRLDPWAADYESALQLLEAEQDPAGTIDLTVETDDWRAVRPPPGPPPPSMAFVDGVRRIGKLLLVDLHGAPTLGLRFGMTGRLLVDGVAAIDALEYGPARESAAWDRFRLDFDGAGRDGGTLVISDPRRLGGVLLDPDESRLGVDAMTLTPAQLAAVLDRSQAPVKARLMDQARLAGVENIAIAAAPEAE